MFVFQRTNTTTNTTVSPTPLPTLTPSPSAPIPDRVSVTSKDGRIQFTSPKTWYLSEQKIPAGGKGQFGPMTDSWLITSFVNTAKIDMEIMEGGRNLSIDQLVDCSGKTVVCEKIGIDSEQFIKRTERQSDGMIVITVATFYDDKILRASGLIQVGPDQQENIKTVEAIFNSFKFIKK